MKIEPRECRCLVRAIPDRDDYMVEWYSHTDDNTLPACQILDGLTLSPTDADDLAYAHSLTLKAMSNQAVKPVSLWQPIDTARKDGSIITVWDTYHKCAVAAFYCPTEEQFMYVVSECEGVNPDHWQQPLPAPPEKEVAPWDNKDPIKHKDIDFTGNDQADIDSGINQDNACRYPPPEVGG